MLARKNNQQESIMHMLKSCSTGIEIKSFLFIETLFRLHFALSSCAINSFLFSSFPQSKAQNLLRFKASEPNK